MSQREKERPPFGAGRGDADVRRRLDKLEAYALADAECPCCEQVLQCLDECSLEEDSSERFDRVMAAREALR